MIRLLYIIILLSINISIFAADILFSQYSPNKNVKVTITKQSEYIIAEVRYKEKIIVPEIRLGIQEFKENFYKQLSYVGVSDKGFVTSQYTNIHGEKKNCKNKGSAFTLLLENSKNKRLNIEFVVYDDGISFRYVLANQELGDLRFIKEFTTYHIPKEAGRWIQRYISHYEGDFLYEKGNEISKGEWGYPALIHYNKYWALFTEANNDRTYCATHLSNIDDITCYQVVYPHKEEGNGLGEVYPVASTPWASPWRVVILGELKNIVESTLVEDVSKPCSIRNTDWIKPGSSSWVYWAYNHGTKDYKICKEYVDLAVAMQWEYVLFDWEWDQMSNGGTIEDAVRYAISKGVKPLIWYNSGGEHNNVLSTPRDRLVTKENRKKEFARLKELGIAGIKIDFFESDKQNMMKYYLDILDDATDYELMVNFHGCTVPRGWSRTYPNLMTMEAVYGAEQYNNSAYMTEAAARLNCIYPFTVIVIGPMDYTPVAFTNSQHPHQTSNTHELALSVIFESGIQHWADRPDSFYKLSTAGKDFMRNVPVAWDEIYFVDGIPGDFVILARRKGKDWYLAGINGSNFNRNFAVKLDFLSLGVKYKAKLFVDGLNINDIKEESGLFIKSNDIQVKCLPQGGFVAHFSVLEE